MDTTTIRTFLLLSQIKNFTRTANQMFVAQSTVTNRIRDLEVEVGTPLFTRNHKQIELTPGGQKFLEYAKRFIALETTALQDLHGAPTYAQQIRLGTTNTVYECHLQKKLRTYLKNKSALSLQVTISHTQTLLQNVQDGLLDAIFTFVPLYKDGYECRLYRTDTLVLVVSSLNKEYASGIYKEDLPKLNYLFCNFVLQGIGIYIQDLFPRHHHFTFEIDNSTKLPQYVADGIGCTFLPRSLIEDDLLQGKLRAIPLLDFAPPKINSYYITRSPNNIPDDLDSFLME
jgi:DNA-binding transcriptional LysR family regulator